MKKIFQPENFFALADFPWRRLFSGVDFIWEVLPRIREFSRGKLVQGNNCRLAGSVHIREGVILGDNIVIGHAVELKNCIVMSNTNIAHLNYIGDGIIGNRVNIGGGAVLANLRLDGREIRFKLANKTIATGLTKFSAAVGDGCKIGANAVINPGSILGKDCQVYPLVSVCGIYPEKSIIK